jgi:hypothetical protein
MPNGEPGAECIIDCDTGVLPGKIDLVDLANRYGLENLGHSSGVGMSQRARLGR